MNQSLKVIKKDLFEDLDIKEFCRDNNLSDSFIFDNLNKFYIYKENNQRVGKCTRENCVMDPYGKHTKLKYDGRKVNLISVDCPVLVPNAIGSINLMFYPNQDILNEDIELISNEDRLEALSLVSDFNSNYSKDKFTKGIYLYGSFGTGKTFIMHYLARLLSKVGVNVIMVNYAEFIISLKNSFGSNRTERLMNDLKYVDVLIIDDIGAESNTAYTRDDVLYPLINFRMQSMLPVCMTSNNSFKELAVHFGESKYGDDKLKSARIMDRLRYLMTEVKLVDRNYRLK